MRSPYDYDEPPKRRRNAPIFDYDPLEDTQPSPPPRRTSSCGCTILVVLLCLVALLLGVTAGLSISDDLVDELKVIWERPTPTPPPATPAPVTIESSLTPTASTTPSNTPTPTSAVFIEITDVPPTATSTNTATDLPTLTPSDTPSITPTPSRTDTPTETDVPTQTDTPVSTDTPRPTDTAQPTTTDTATRRPTQTETAFPTTTDTATRRPVSSATQRDTVTPLPPTITPSPTQTSTPQPPSLVFENISQEADVPDVLEIEEDSCSGNTTSFLLVFEPGENLESINVFFEARGDDAEITEIEPQLPDFLTFYDPISITLNNLVMAPAEEYPPSGVTLSRAEIDVFFETVLAQGEPIKTFALAMQNTGRQPRMEYRIDARHPDEGGLYLRIIWQDANGTQEAIEPVKLC
jgi:hypothetical protein